VTMTKVASRLPWASIATQLSVPPTYLHSVSCRWSGSDTWTWLQPAGVACDHSTDVTTPAARPSDLASALIVGLIG
jgi:hypothetical protein